MSAYIGKKPVDVLTYDHWTDTAKYTSRTTADGLEIIDGRLARVTKIQGDTVKPTGTATNLFYTVGNYTSYAGVTISYNEETQEYTFNGTTNSAGNVVLSTPLKIPNLTAGKYYTVVRIKTGGTVTFPTGAYMLWALFNSANNNEYGTNRLYENSTTANTTTIAQATKLPVCDGFDVYLQFLNDSIGTVFNNFRFKLLIIEGEYTANNLPAMAGFSGLKHAFFESIKSTGRNLFNVDEFAQKIVGAGKGSFETFQGKRCLKIVHDGGASVGVELPSGIIHGIKFMSYVDGDNPPSSFFTVKKSNGTYFYTSNLKSREWAEYRAFNIYADWSIEHISLWCQNPNDPVYIDLDRFVCFGVPEIDYEPYKESTFDFPLSIELKKWDYILPQAQKIVRKTKTVTKPTPFTDEEISQYPNAIVALDKLSLIYEGEETVNELDMPKGYTAWRGGTETVIQGTNDNSVYGAMPTIQTAYANRVYRGVIQCQSKENKRE